MRYLLLILSILMHFTLTAESMEQQISDQTILLLPQEIEDIRAEKELYAYFGPAVSSLIDDIPSLQKYMDKENLCSENFTRLYNVIKEGKTTAPASLIEKALADIINAVYTNKISLPHEEAEKFIAKIKTYYTQFSSGQFDLTTTHENDSDTITRSNSRTFCSVKVKGKLCAGCLFVKHNATIGGNLTVEGNETVEGDLTIRGNEIVAGDLTVLGTVRVPIEPIITNNLELVGMPQQACIIFVDETLTEKARICSSPIPGDQGLFVSVDSGATQNLRVLNGGGVTIAPPTGGETGLTINGGGETINAGDLNVVTGNIILPQANAGGTQGLLQLGGTDGTTNVSVYDFGTRNLFEGNGAVNATVTGADNISIGTTANSGLTTQNNTVAIGTNAAATGTDSVTIGNGANTTAARTITIGSRDSTSTGVAPTTTAANAIAFGSAQGTNAGASATGLSSIALGGADGTTFTGASATGDRSIAVGVNAAASAASSIALGSASGVAGGAGPVANNTNAIAIGSTSSASAGPISSGISAIAIGSADPIGVFPGASATGNRSIAVGINSSAASSASIAIGGASGTVGGNGPVATNIGAIAIGSAHLTRTGAIASGISAIAIGCADGTSAAISNFPAAAATGNRSIAIGGNTIANADGAIAIGSAGTAVGTGATASNSNAIAIGAANGATVGATASGISSVALGGAAAGVAGASASGLRSVAIGNGASTAQADAILLGNAAVGAVKIGIGIAGPTAKLHVVGVNGTPVTRLDQVNTAIGNAPVWLNPSTSAVAGTPVHFDGANRLFGFTSSQRYKTNIRSINNESEIIYHLNPVIYDPKEGYGEGKDIPGFIAEEVYEIAPHLAVLNHDKKPETVAYSSLHALAIKEIQKQQKQLEEQNTLIQNQATIINNLTFAMEQLQFTMKELEKYKLSHFPITH